MNLRIKLVGVTVGLILASTVEAAPRWKELLPAGGAPSPRRGVAGIHDAAHNRLVFQGAETADVRFLPEVWFFDLAGNTWSQFSDSRPDARCHHTFLIDGERGRGLLFGGFPRTDKLWSWDVVASTWTDITPAVGNPPPRCLHTSVICSSRAEMIVYGGLRGGFTPDLSDTWSYDLADDSWTLLVEDSPPGRRYGHVAALDEARDRMIVFGGFRRNGINGRLEDVGDLWAFDLATRTWTELSPSNPGPSPRQFARGATMPDGSGMILFGGRSDVTGVMNDLWLLSFEDLNWTELEPEGSLPPPRFRHTLILDETGNRLWVAFGEGVAGRHYADVWTLDLKSMKAPSTTFQRGDVNADGTRNISDAVFTLLFLFGGGTEPPCAKSADVDDNGVLQLTDAVLLLDALFLGHSPPASPYGSCGPDPTEDELTCDSHAPCSR